MKLDGVIVSILTGCLVSFSWLPLAVDASGHGDDDGFHQPTEYHSVNGRLEVTLTVDMLESLNGTRVAPAYNGEPCGPTLRVKPGDTLVVTLENKLPVTAMDRALHDYVMDPNSDVLNATIISNRLDANGNIYNPMYGFWGFGFVNLHFHGMEFSPSEEDIEHVVGNGESKVYTFEIPQDQGPGLFWYHNHVHGIASHSYLSSLFGFIIVEGTDSDIDKAPGLENATEVLMIFSEGLVNEDKTVPPFFPIVYTFNWHSVVNGYLDTDTMYTFTQGETVLFRTVSATVEPVIRFVIPGVTFWIVAYDGHPVPTPMQVDEVSIGGGQRIEFLARFDEPGTYEMIRLQWGDEVAPNEAACQAIFGGPYPCISYGIDKPVGSIVVEPAPNGTALPTGSVMDGVQLPEYSDRLKRMQDMPIAASKTFSFDQAHGYPIFQFSFDGNFAPPATNFGVNGRLGSPHEVIGDVTVDTCESWTLLTEGEHPFHAHAGKFYVTSMNNTAVDEIVWRDTFIIHAGISPVEIKVCFDRIKPCDIILLHCHVVSHLDIGMFAQLRAVDENGICDELAPTTMPAEAPTKAPTETEAETPTSTPSFGVTVSVRGFTFTLLLVMTGFYMV